MQFEHKLLAVVYFYCYYKKTNSNLNYFLSMLSHIELWHQIGTGVV